MRRLPRLIWVAVMALVPEGGLGLRVLVVPMGLLVGLLLAAARWDGQLAAGDRWVLIVMHRRWAAARLGAGVVLILTTIAVPIMVVAQYCTVVELAGKALLAYLAVLWVIGLMLVSVQKVRRRGAAPVTIPPGVIELTYAAAWPRHAGCGSRLWDQLVPALAGTGRTVMARAVTRAWAQRYAGRTCPRASCTGTSCCGGPHVSATGSTKDRSHDPRPWPADRRGGLGSTVRSSGPPACDGSEVDASGQQRVAAVAAVDVTDAAVAADVEGLQEQAFERFALPVAEVGVVAGLVGVQEHVLLVDAGAAGAAYGEQGRAADPVPVTAVVPAAALVLVSAADLAGQPLSPGQLVAQAWRVVVVELGRGEEQDPAGPVPAHGFGREPRAGEGTAGDVDRAAQEVLQGLDGHDAAPDRRAGHGVPTSDGEADVAQAEGAFLAAAGVHDEVRDDDRWLRLLGAALLPDRFGAALDPVDHRGALTVGLGEQGDGTQPRAGEQLQPEGHRSTAAVFYDEPGSVQGPGPLAGVIEQDVAAASSRSTSVSSSHCSMFSHLAPESGRCAPSWRHHDRKGGPGGRSRTPTVGRRGTTLLDELQEGLGVDVELHGTVGGE